MGAPSIVVPEGCHGSLASIVAIGLCLNTDSSDAREPERRFQSAKLMSTARKSRCLLEDGGVLCEPVTAKGSATERLSDLVGPLGIKAPIMSRETLGPILSRLLVDMTGTALTRRCGREDDLSPAQGEERDQPVTQLWTQMLGNLEAVCKVEHHSPRRSLEVKRPRIHALAPGEKATESVVLKRHRCVSAADGLGRECAAARAHVKKASGGRERLLEHRHDRGSIGNRIIMEVQEVNGVICEPSPAKTFA
jgi:hypothetical protein